MRVPACLVTQEKGKKQGRMMSILLACVPFSVGKGKRTLSATLMSKKTLWVTLVASSAALWFGAW